MSVALIFVQSDFFTYTMSNIILALLTKNLKAAKQKFNPKIKKIVFALENILKTREKRVYGKL